MEKIISYLRPQYDILDRSNWEKYDNYFGDKVSLSVKLYAILCEINPIIDLKQKFIVLDEKGVDLYIAFLSKFCFKRT